MSNNNSTLTCELTQEQCAALAEGATLRFEYDGGIIGRHAEIAVEVSDE